LNAKHTTAFLRKNQPSPAFRIYELNTMKPREFLLATASLELEAVQWYRESEA
jgi:hypothetical protein